jgi:hypothetical protein
MSYNYYIGTKKPDFVDVNNSDFPTSISMGIYVGTVKEHDLETRNGRIWVYIPGFGNNPNAADNDSKSWTTVTYASPFLGYTERNQSVIPQTNFESSGQSYGMSIPMPDIGSEVLCCFPGGRKEKNGYWFACVNSNLSRNMVPGIGALSYENIDPESIPTFIRSELIDPKEKYPVGEFNNIFNLQKNNFQPTWYQRNLRPLHLPRAIQYWNQGLNSDNERGPISSSVQRDAVNVVFGISTPGRPVNDPAKDVAIRQKASTTNKDTINFDDQEVGRSKLTSRIGGHSIIMDDGDFEGKNNLVRIRSSAGHQITMNDSEGFIYITTASGGGYIELTADGQLIIYNANDISVRSQNNIMFHADHNFQVNAEKIYLKANQEIKMQSPKIETYAEDLLNLYGKRSQLRGSLVTVNSANNLSLSAAGYVVVGGDSIYLNSGGSVQSFNPPTKLRNYNFPDNIGVTITDESVAEYTDDKTGTFTVWKETPGNAMQSINYRVPTHEPYKRDRIPNKASATTTTTPRTRSFAAQTTAASDLESEIAYRPGVARAVREPLNTTKKASISTFIKEANNLPAERGVGSLSRDAMTAYKAQIGHTESGSSYKPISAGTTVEGLNAAGYAGKYQLGSGALQDLGFLKPGTPQTVEAINNPNNWIGGPGKPANLQEFLSNGEMQEKAMQSYTESNYKTLTQLGLINDKTSPEVTAGYLAGSHLGGPGGVQQWASGSFVKPDANGTTISQYFNLGRYSQSQVTTITASLASKP